MIALRSYQEDAIATTLDYWNAGGGNPLVDLATGTGKSVVIAELTRRLLSNFPDLRVLMLVHVKELVAQNCAAVQRLWPQAPIGLYSAGLGKRESYRQIVFASVQSVYRKARELGRRDLVLIDECHLVPNAGNGMYRRLLDDLAALPGADMRVAGFSATPYRLDSGRLDAGADRLFDETVFSYGIGQGIADGHLSPLISKASASEIDVSSVQRRGGEFVAGSLEAAAMDDDLIRRAVDETIRFGQDRRSWLVFCSGVAHAIEVRDAMRARGIHAETVTGDTPTAERDRIIQDFRCGRIRCLTNANVLTTGFDAPATDLVVMLRPTLSTGLYVQIVGRGTRLANGKENCLVLDFAGNIRRHGPVDAVSVGPSKSGKTDGKVEVGEVRSKACPNCESMAALNASSCKECGYEWPHNEKPKHEAEADANATILSSEPQRPQSFGVVDWQLRRWEKAGSPPTIRVDYVVGLTRVSEWVCPEHDGYAGRKAAEWWSRHQGTTPYPDDVDEFLDRSSELTMPAAIFVKQEGKYQRVVGREFGAQAA
ncbi:ATP-dependent helicase [Aureimonas endophytica]|uniref:ATP-dependent helicase n=1 Tax=Aureimonas endophytica TaxID=2027858 RepID=A0A917EA21_9HYPH|nr:DEAD/DEAH box helicase [Aureimonas endophytica]GGE18314.1 ATP-dependent helicase [Aureimonas endophytica]